jgi:hypothetical protein
VICPYYWRAEFEVCPKTVCSRDKTMRAAQMAWTHPASRDFRDRFASLIIV